MNLFFFLAVFLALFAGCPYLTDNAKLTLWVLSMFSAGIGFLGVFSLLIKGVIT